MQASPPRRRRSSLAPSLLNCFSVRTPLRCPARTLVKAADKDVSCGGARRPAACEHVRSCSCGAAVDEVSNCQRHACVWREARLLDGKHPGIGNRWDQTHQSHQARGKDAFDASEMFAVTMSVAAANGRHSHHSSSQSCAKKVGC